MDSDNEVSPQRDEIILCVRYRMWLSWLMGLGCMVFVYWVGSVAYALIQRGDYLLAAICGAACFVMIAAGVEAFLSEAILFYRDRLVKVYRLLGTRTVPYACARLYVAPRLMQQWPGLRRASKSLKFQKIDDNGRVLLRQVPVIYCWLCASPETREKVQAVVSYLVGIEDTSRLYEKPRIFVRSTLPKDLPSPG